jgi:hypothetical protein
MRCGNCKNHHATVDNVRACYNGESVEAEEQVERVVSVWPASEAQINYALGLQEERNLPDGYVIRTRDELTNMDRAQVSDIIVLLKSMSRAEGKGVGNYTMPPGRYAVQNDDEEWEFFEVSKPTEGRWKGYTFITLLVGSPGQYRKVKMGPERRNSVLRIIEANQKEAMLNYGQFSGVCGRCSSPLTDPQSLARGIGPKCATMSGWF